MARKTTIAAFGEWSKVEANIEDVLERIAGGKQLQRVCREVKQPYTCLHEFFHQTPENLARYEAARKAWADAVMEEALRIADGVKPDRDHVAKARLRVETRQNQAKAWHRDRWGDRVQVEKDVTVTADAALIGFASDLLLAGKRPALVIENAPGQAMDVSGNVAADTPAVALPAPAGRAE